METKLEGCQTPRYAIVPNSTFTDGQMCGELAAEYGLKPDPWQQAVLDGWLACYKDGSYVAGTCGLAVPRQNGKNAVLEMVELFKCAVQGRKILHTAHEVKTCRKAFLRLKGFFENEKEYPELVELVQIIRQTNGQEAITLKNGGSIEFIARSKSSGLGFTVDDVICDEAQLLDQEQVATLRPTMSAAPSGNPQMIMTGTPPRPNTPGDVFEMTRKRAITGDDKRTCWFEWSVEEVGNVRDFDRVASVNPALGRRLQINVIEDELATMDTDGFARERLGWWATTGYKRVIDPEVWKKCGIEANESPKEGKMGVGVKFSQDGTKYALSIALKSKDKPLYVEFYDYGNMSDGIRPLSDWILERKNKIACVAIDGKSGCDALVQMLNDGGFPRKGIMLPGTRGVVAASSQFLNDVNEGNVTHLNGQEQMDESALKSEKRLIGRDGGWGFGGEFSLPVESAAIGLWGVKETRRSPGRGSRIL